MNQLVSRISAALGRVWPAVLAFLRETVEQVRATTGLRVLRELLAIVIVLGLDVFPGWMSEHPPRGWAAIGSCAVLAVLVLARLRLPALALLALMLVAIGGAAVLILLSFGAGYRIASWRRSLITVVLALPLFLWGALRQPDIGVGGPLIWYMVLAIFGLAVVLPFLIGRYVAQRAALVAALREREQRLRREHVMISRQVRLRERNRIAQDMHDSLGHRLSLISVHAGALELDPGLGPQQRESVRVLRSAALGAMEELRSVIGVLRTSGDEGEDPGGRTVDSVEELIGGSRRAGTAVSLTTGGQQHELPVPVSHAAYRVIQEGLTNAHKHAPGAAVAVAVRYEPDALVVEVRNGPSTDQKQQDGRGAGVGLIGLRERIRLVGGLTHVGQLPDGGFRIAAVLPYEEPSGADRDSDADEDLRPLGEPHGDVSADEPRPGNRVRSWAGTGSIVTAGVVLLVVLVGFAWVIAEYGGAAVSRETYDNVQVGQPEVQVRTQLPARHSPDEPTLHRGAEPEPSGATCAYYQGAEQEPGAKTNRVLRFCFADGKLVEKNTYIQEW
ncbi:two-component sensor histidine kinase [Solihabitans fulvus]|uniref:histidine kinase n=1 Tax=Solihabitans fulvus TaxID=1892852 RepID=A0A5B2X5Q3_9PSEU|nr:histidine kinase [Solihabitans fulvus]KAA2258525.1 two-component sensor histidine kinase [Solihabitans fulvus]